MKVLKVEEKTIQVDIGGAGKTVRLDIIDRQPKVGDYVIVHAGFALHVIDEEEAKTTLGYFKELLSGETEASQ
jgi:hydrogenase expression/formation protein HypC